MTRSSRTFLSGPNMEKTSEKALLQLVLLFVWNMHRCRRRYLGCIPSLEERQQIRSSQDTSLKYLHSQDVPAGVICIAVTCTRHYKSLLQSCVSVSKQVLNIFIWGGGWSCCLCKHMFTVICFLGLMLVLFSATLLSQQAFTFSGLFFHCLFFFSFHVPAYLTNTRN